MRIKKLPEDYVLVLQQINEDGSDGFNDLAEMLKVDKRRLSHIVQSLQHKGLIRIEQGTIFQDAWLSLSSKGKRFINYLWPESKLSQSY